VRYVIYIYDVSRLRVNKRIAVSQYNETNVMHFLFSLLRIKCLVHWLPARMFSGGLKFQRMLLVKKSYLIDFAFKFNDLKFYNLFMNFVSL
jgi:hypothetical protein